MNKSTHNFLFSGLLGISIVLLLVGLFFSIVPQYPERSSSMIAGTIVYIGLALLAFSAKKHSTLSSKFLILSGLGLAGIHIYTEIQLLTSIGLFAITNMLGYTALISIGLAIGVKVLNKISKTSLGSLSLNGFLTAGVAFTYWHVASINIVRESLLFFIPFSILFFLTVGQFIYKILKERNRTYISVNS
ncbi:hypothetical protein [Marinilactibacillus psychrotolerans]|uniref:DUF308 domain-containing protein n=1 Tax=Marinilactibacillus psychrotolerans TaxID=191770 RepID=A0AAV3WYL0_9LACT|nr:hypothetical protein [Marinilactibacillus psychrotolerans]GEL68120.1 hypothetical protein MPS01_22750 [Marinilactibacillus psychrotolerans]GEQ36834.1 hypothetical protein M132T_23420 [Marinilactibacillus psychrotolerans]SDD37068.1 hypothetical protein SAMN04488013_1287 [Marinilactibacillus psychrotolerans]